MEKHSVSSVQLTWERRARRSQNARDDNGGEEGDREGTHSGPEPEQEHWQSVHVGKVALEEERDRLELAVRSDVELEVLLEHLASFKKPVVDELRRKTGGKRSGWRSRNARRDETRRD